MRLVAIAVLAFALVGCVVEPGYYATDPYYDSDMYAGYYYSRVIFIEHVPYYVDFDRRVRPIPVPLRSHFRRLEYARSGPPAYSRDTRMRDGYPLSRIIYIDNVPHYVGDDRRPHPLPREMRDRFRYSPEPQYEMRPGPGGRDRDRGNPMPNPGYGRDEGRFPPGRYQPGYPGMNPQGTPSAGRNMPENGRPFPPAQWRRDNDPRPGAAGQMIERQEPGFAPRGNFSGQWQGSRLPPEDRGGGTPAGNPQGQGLRFPPRYPGGGVPMGNSQDRETRFQQPQRDGAPSWRQGPRFQQPQNQGGGAPAGNSQGQGARFQQPQNHGGGAPAGNSRGQGTRFQQPQNQGGGAPAGNHQGQGPRLRQSRDQGRRPSSDKSQGAGTGGGPGNDGGRGNGRN